MHGRMTRLVVGIAILAGAMLIAVAPAHGGRGGHAFHAGLHHGGVRHPGVHPGWIWIPAAPPPPPGPPTQ
jgi:hypothetical protein